MFVAAFYMNALSGFKGSRQIYQRSFVHYSVNVNKFPALGFLLKINSLR